MESEAGDEYYNLINDDLDNSDDSCNDGTIRSCAPLREQDRFLPIANVAKIMKKAIPENGKIAKDARECVQECVSEFISFITSEASERCYTEKRKTINGEDILFAMVQLGFEPYVESLKLYLQKYREVKQLNTNKNLNNNFCFQNSKPDKTSLPGADIEYDLIPSPMPGNLFSEYFFF